MSESCRGTSAIRRNRPARQVVATFDDYADAESAVDSRSDQHFAVDESAIDGHDIEQVVGRSNYGRAALRGAAAGGLTSALFGWLFALGGRRDFTSTQPSQTTSLRSPRRRRGRGRAVRLLIGRTDRKE